MPSLLHPEAERQPFTCREALAGVVNDQAEIDFLLEAGTRYKAYELWDKIKTGKGYDSLPGVTSGFNARKLDPTKPSPTIRKNDGELGMFGGMHWTEKRKFTVREYSRLGSFPDQFRWPEAWKNTVNQIGNSVPPLFMRAVAAQIRHVVFGGPEPWMPKEKTTYKQVLDEAWAKHQQKHSEDAPTLISTFAGCGGSSLGYSIAGFQEKLAVEWDKHAVRTFRDNFPGVDVFAGDIADLSVDEALKRTGLQPGELDLLDGSPPCQGFSTAGKRVLSDDRNKLFLEFGRLLSGLRPKVFVMENVSGMVKGKMKVVFAEILRDLKGRGYKVSARLLNAMWYNVPQSRQRLIFIGVRDDLGIDPSHPRPKKKPVTAGEALSECKIKKWARPLGPTAKKVWHTARPGQSGKSLDWTNGNFFSSLKVDPEKPSPTILKEFPGTGGHMHWEDPRSLSIEELKRLTSFPDQFSLAGSFEHQWARIGNSVPPMLMEAIAKHTMEEILL